MMILPSVLFMRSMKYGSRFFQAGFRVIESRLRGGKIQIRGFHLFGKMFANGFLDFAHVNVEQLGHHADVEHVFYQLAQLGFRTDGATILSKGTE